MAKTLFQIDLQVVNPDTVHYAYIRISTFVWADDRTSAIAKVGKPNADKIIDMGEFAGNYLCHARKVRNTNHQDILGCDRYIANPNHKLY